MNTLTPIEKSIWKTVCWFGLFEYPLTVFDLWKWMIDPPREMCLGEVYDMLETSDWLKDNLIQKDGFVLPAGMEDVDKVFERRHERFLDAMRKYDRLRKSVKYLSRVPGVRGVAAVNTLGWWNTSKGSDIDMLIITHPDQLWTSRFLSVLPYLLMRKRPGSGLGSDPLCFSFFLNHETTNIEYLGLKDDPYFYYWSRSCVPVFEQNSCFERFYTKNRWAKKRLPHTHRPLSTERIYSRAKKQTFSLGRIVERLFRYLQLKRLPQEIKDLAAKHDTRVVVGGAMLKFHTNDRREQYREAWLDAVESFQKQSA